MCLEFTTVVIEYIYFVSLPACAEGRGSAVVVLFLFDVLRQYLTVGDVRNVQRYRGAAAGCDRPTDRTEPHLNYF